MRRLLLSSAAAALLLVSTLLSDSALLQPLAGFGLHGDGTVLPGDVWYLTADGGRFERGMAYNPATDHLLVMYRFPGGGAVGILNAQTGEDTSNSMDTSAQSPDGNQDFVYNLIGVADDGAVYAANLNDSATPVIFNLYRWSNETASQTLVYSGDPRGLYATNNLNTRWGDTLAVRGAGLNTEVLISTRNGSLVALLRPADSFLTNFVALPLATDLPAGAASYGLTFGPGNSFYGKSASAAGNPLYLVNYDTNVGTATTLHVYGTDVFPGRSGPLAAQTTGNLLAAIEMANNPDRVRLYDISTPAGAPALLDRQAFPTNVANTIYAGAVAFANGRLYAMDSDHGIMGFSLAAGTRELAPTIIREPPSAVVQVTSNVLFAVAADGTAPLSYQWFYNSTPVTGATTSSLGLTNVPTGASGNYTVVVTNHAGSVTSAVATLYVLASYGNLLVYDPFDYAADSALVPQGGWVLNSGTSGKVEAGNLDVPGLAPSVGNRVALTATGSTRKPIGTYTNGALYFSFALRMENLGTSTSSETVAGLAQGTTTTFAGKINVVGDGANTSYQIGIYKSSGTGNGALAPNVFSPTDTVFVVARYVFNFASGTDDTCDLWLNPDPATFGAANPPPPTVGPIGAGATDMPLIDRFFLRFSSGYPRRVFDEVRVGFAWAEVTPSARPYLAIARSGTNAVVSWPANSPAGYGLESISKFDDPDGWQPVTTQVITVGTNRTVTLPVTGTRLFRLKQ